jgi:tetratricopeptide (TPR) repeat protein
MKTCLPTLSYSLKSSYSTKETLAMQPDSKIDEDIHSLFKEGIISYNRHQFNDAFDRFQEVKGIIEEKPANHYEDLEPLYFNMGLCLHHFGRNYEAIDYYEKSLELALGNYKDKVDAIPAIITEMVSCLIELKKSDRVPEYVNQYLNLAENHHEGPHFNTALGYALMGRAYLKQEDYDMAVQYLKKSQEIYNELDVKNHHMYGIMLVDLGHSLQNLEQLDKAAKITKQGVDILMKSKPTNYSELKDGLMRLSQVYHKQARYDLALKACETAKKMLNIKSFDLDLSG